jgi:uncharacterized protein YcbX
MSIIELSRLPLRMPMIRPAKASARAGSKLVWVAVIGFSSRRDASILQEWSALDIRATTDAYDRREVGKVSRGKRSTMHVTELWRHPVKSMQGERLDEAAVEATGVTGDRRWGVVDRDTGVVLNAKRVPLLLLASARLHDAGVEVVLPDGEVLHAPSAHADEVLSRWLGRAVTLVDAEAFGAGVSEFFSDAVDESSAIVSWTMPSGRFVDAMPLLVVTTASLRQGRGLYPDGQWETRRFRPNIVVDLEGEGWIEDEWCGRTVQVGNAAVQPAVPCERCTLVTRPQSGLDRDLDIFKTLAREHGKTFGVWSIVQTPGLVRVGDEVQVATSRTA